MAVRWGMIGAGDVAEVKSGPAFSRVPNSTLVAIMRRDASRAADYASRHSVPRWSSNADDVLLADDIDAVYVATPTSSHREYVLRAARAGKHVYVEKPMGLDHAECVEMIDACDSAGVSLWVGYYRRALPRFLRVKQLLDSQAIGDVRAVVSRVTAKLPSAAEPLDWRTDPLVSGGSYFFEGACHTLDILDFLLGPITDVRAIARNQARAWSAEDIVSGAYLFEGGVVGSGLWSYASDRNEEYNEIIGSAGRIRFSTTHPSPIVVTIGDDVTELRIGDPDHVHEPLIAAIVAELEGAPPAPSTGQSAARTARVMDALVADLRGT